MKNEGIYQHLGLLSEPLRVRLLRLLQKEELAVGELTRILQVPQSTVSRHLKALALGGWVVRRTEGTSTWLRMATETLSEEALGLWQVVGHSQTHQLICDEDQQRLQTVLAARHIDSKSFFGRVASEWSSLRRALFGADFTFPALLSMLPEHWVVGDLGCGTAEVAELVAPAVRKVIAVDREQAMLEAAAARLDGVDNVELRCGDLAALPIEDGALDAAICALVLHHIANPGQVLTEVRRALTPQGRAVIVDMVEHDRAVYRRTMGHHHLGFSPERLEALARSAGLELAHWRTLPIDNEAQGPGLFVATLRPSDASASDASTKSD